MKIQMSQMGSVKIIPSGRQRERKAVILHFIFVGRLFVVFLHAIKHARAQLA